MGLMDGFTSDGTVEMKHTEYYKLMREAVKAELTENAARCNVPHEYIREMLTGEREAQAILPEVEVDPDYEVENILTAARRFLRMMPDEERVTKGAENLRRIVELAEMERLDEIILANDEKLKDKDAAQEKKTPDSWSCETCKNNAMRGTFTAGECETCEDGSHYEAIDGTGQQAQGEGKEDGSNGND